jgi:DNA polymerase-3 subunit alpha
LDKLFYELSVIDKMGFNDYFLIVGDFVSYAKGRGIPVGPGRGSAAGSIVSYCLGITDVDPVKYNLLFERFLNPDRISMPDIDIDFCYERRQEVINYVVEKYGADRVSQIITFGTMAARGAIRDVAGFSTCLRPGRRACEKWCPGTLALRWTGAGGFLHVQTGVRGKPRTPKKVVDMARKLEGMPRHASTHAAGVVISARPIYEYVPLSKNDEAVVTQFPMGTLEKLGLLKMDFLGLRTLTVLSDACREIRRAKPGFDLEKIPLDDKKVFALLQKGQTEGIFQLESGGMKQMLMSLKRIP